MNEQEINIAVAKATGYKVLPDGGNPEFPWILHEPKGASHGGFKTESAAWLVLYNKFTRDLNAMHEAEKVLTDDERKEYSFILCGYSSDDLRADLLFDEIHTPAAQRAVAFLKAKKLWADTP